MPNRYEIPDSFRDIRKNLERQRDVTLSNAHVRKIVQTMRSKFGESESQIWHFFCRKPCVARSERSALRKIERRGKRLETLMDIRKVISA